MLEAVADEDELYRRLAPHHIKEGGRVSSSAFKRGKIPDPEVSVNLARLTTIEETLATRPEHGVGMLPARLPRSIGLTVRHDPVSDNHAHTVIEGQTSRQQPRELAEGTVILRLPSPGAGTAGVAGAD